MYTVSVVSIAMMALVEAAVISLFLGYLYVVRMLRKELLINRGRLIDLRYNLASHGPPITQHTSYFFVLLVRQRLNTI